MFLVQITAIIRNAEGTKEICIRVYRCSSVVNTFQPRRTFTVNAPGTGFSDTTKR